MAKKYNYTKKTGRPTKYNDTMLKKAKEYLKSCTDEVEDYVKSEGGLSTSYERIIKVDLPTREGLALHLGVDPDTLRNWEAEHADFFGTLREIDAEQKKRLLNNGLSGDYNPTIAKLILSANHGMREGVDHTTNGKDLPVPILGKFTVDGE